jgi:hypothetical protein
VRRVTVAATLALTAVLLAGCGGGGDDQAKVEASLRRYLVGLPPDQNPFPMGAGAPRVQDNSCVKRGTPPIRSRTWMPLPGTYWQCVVKFGTRPMLATIVVDNSTEVVAAGPKPLPPRPTTTYSNTPPEAKPNASQPSTGWSPLSQGATAPLAERGILDRPSGPREETGWHSHLRSSFDGLTAHRPTRRR